MWPFINVYFLYRSGLGNHYGTLSGPISAFSPAGKTKKPYQSSGKNFYTNPGRRGTGFGYVFEKYILEFNRRNIK